MLVGRVSDRETDTDDTLRDTDDTLRDTDDTLRASHTRLEPVIHA